MSEEELSTECLCFRENDNNNVSKSSSDEEMSTENPNSMHAIDLDPTPRDHDKNQKNIEKYEIFEHINNNIENIIHISHS